MLRRLLEILTGRDPCDTHEPIQRTPTDDDGD